MYTFLRGMVNTLYGTFCFSVCTEYSAQYLAVSLHKRGLVLTRDINKSIPKTTVNSNVGRFQHHRHLRRRECLVIGEECGLLLSMAGVC